MTGSAYIHNTAESTVYSVAVGCGYTMEHKAGGIDVQLPTYGQPTVQTGY